MKFHNRKILMCTSDHDSWIIEWQVRALGRSNNLGGSISVGGGAQSTPSNLIEIGLTYLQISGVAAVVLLTPQFQWPCKYFAEMSSNQFKIYYESWIFTIFFYLNATHRPGTHSRTKRIRLLKYGFCKKLLQYKWGSDQLKTFFLIFFQISSNQHCWSGKKENKSVQLVRGSFVSK